MLSRLAIILVLGIGTLFGYGVASGTLKRSSPQEKTSSDQAPASSDTGRDQIPRADPPFKGVANRTLAGLEAGLPEAGRGPEGRPERAARAGR